MITSVKVSIFVAGAIAALALSIPSHAKIANPPVKRKVTFAADIAPIIYDKCANCHHAGEVAPFNLTSYAEVKAKAKTIAAVAAQKYMPPWQAISHGEFVNERTLTDDQISMLKEWADAGAPEGNTANEPKPPTFTPGWQGGKPDFVGEPASAYKLSSEGDDIYRCFVIHTSYPTDRFVRTVELKPGNRKVVHHVLVYIDTSGTARKMDGKDGAIGYTSFGGPGFDASGALGGWAPGLGPQKLPAGEGMLLPKGADIVLQVHYHKNGKPEEDLTRIGLTFADGPVDKEVRWREVGTELISIPAGDAHYEVKAKMVIPADVTVLDVIPHMHLLGHDMRVVATFPDGSSKELINVAPYDFNWQTRYAYKEAVKLPKGTRLDLVAHYDNSTGNLHNPNTPPRRVTFGEQTTDEMCYAFFSYTIDREHLAKGQKAGDEMDKSITEAALDNIFEKFDADKDGYLSTDELASVIKFFQASQPGGGKMDVASTSKFLVGMYGKTKRGYLSRAEFGNLVRGVSQKAKSTQ